MQQLNKKEINFFEKLAFSRRMLGKIVHNAVCKLLREPILNLQPIIWIDDFIDGDADCMSEDFSFHFCHAHYQALSRF